MPSKWKISFPHRFFHLCYWVTWRIRVFGTYREKGASQVVLVVKNPAANAGDAGSIPGLGRSPGGGHGNPLLYTCLENPMDRGVWQATIHMIAKSQTRLSNLAHMHSCMVPAPRNLYYNWEKENECCWVMENPILLIGGCRHRSSW